MKEPLASIALKACLNIVFALGILGIITLPWMLDFYFEYFYDAYFVLPGYRLFILIFLMVTAALVLLIVWEMIAMLRSIPSGPFILRNVRALRRIGVVLLALAALFFSKCVLYVTMLTMACGFMFALCALFAFTLANLFRQAVAFKEENDLTI